VCSTVCIFAEEGPVHRGLAGESLLVCSMGVTLFNILLTIHFS